MEQSEAQRLYSYIGDSHNDLGVYTVNGGYGPPLPESNRKKKKKKKKTEMKPRNNKKTSCNADVRR
jgi:hypothetical protein